MDKLRLAGVVAAFGGLAGFSSGAEPDVDGAAPLVVKITKMPREGVDVGKAGGTPWWFQAQVEKSNDPRYAVGTKVGANVNRRREPKGVVLDKDGKEMESYFDMKVGMRMAMFCIDAPGKFYRVDQNDPWTHTCGVLKQVDGDGHLDGGGAGSGHGKKHKKKRRGHEGRGGPVAS